METGNEIKGFNIAEALKYAPKGLKIYSPLFGEVKFERIGDENSVVLKDKYNNLCWFYEYGTFFPSDERNYPESECLLFPSIHCRTWQHWQNTLFLESIGSVCVDTIIDDKFILDYNGTFFSDGTGHPYSALIEEDGGNYLLNSRYATQEETKEFFEELEKNGYMWDGKMVVKIEDNQKFYVGDNVYTWEDGKGLKKEQNKPKFKVGDLIRNKQTGLCITIAEVTDDCYYSRAKTCLLFKFQDNWELVYPQNELSIKQRVTLIEDCIGIHRDQINKLADEIIDLKQIVKALEIQAIRQCSDKNRLDSLESKMIILDSHNINNRLDALESRVFPIPEICKCSDKAGDNVTLEEMKS